MVDCVAPITIPPMTRPINMCMNVLPKYEYIENPMDGIKIKVVECLLPTNDIKNNDKKLPATDPIENTADIQEISSLSNGPLVSGASGAINIGIIGVIQPKAKPEQIFIRLAIHVQNEFQK